MWAKQSTAATLIVGPILDSTGVEYASAVIGDLSLSKNGATLTALASAATLTYIANGYYTLVTTTGNTDTLGRAQVTCNKSTYQMPPLNLMIVPAMVFDSLILGSDRLDANVTHVADTAQTARDLGTSVLLSSGTGTGQVSLSSGAVILTSAYDFAKGTVAVTESYSADGAAPTPVQALMGIMQLLTEKSISSTTMTVKKLDGSTTAMTLTLNDATTPTAVTRAS